MEDARQVAKENRVDTDEATVIDSDDDGGPGLLSEVSFLVTAGVTYYIQVGGFGGATGELALNVSLTP